MPIDPLGFLSTIGGVEAAATVLSVLHRMAVLVEALLGRPLSRKDLVDAAQELLVPHGLLLSNALPCKLLLQLHRRLFQRLLQLVVYRAFDVRQTIV